MDEKWLVRSVPPGEYGPGYWRIENMVGMENLIVAASTGKEALVLDVLVTEANLGAAELAEAQAEEVKIDAAVDAAMATVRSRTPAQSADGFLRDALVMLADRRYAGEWECGTAVKAIGRALKAVGVILSGELIDAEFAGCAPAEEVPDGS